MTVSLLDLAATDQLLVICDFDGTIAGFDPDPYAVPVNTASLAALARLAGLPDTNVAVLSGRHLKGLAQVCHLAPPVITAGSHGAETSEQGVVLTAEQETALAGVEEQLQVIADAHAPAYVEVKPLQRVLHVAPLAETDPAAARHVLQLAAGVEQPGASGKPGHNIMEFSVATVNKGDWITAERERRAATATVFLGDDTTDEDGFKILGDNDLGVKVGPGDTAAGHRVADRDGVASLLTQLAELRARHTGLPRELAAKFQAVAAGMTAEVLRVGDWDAQTPCEQWVARDIICHLTSWYPQNLALADVDLQLQENAEHDPVAAWQELVAKVQELLEDPEASAAVFTDGPDRGVTVAKATNGFFVPDVFMHTWDLARSQGHDVELDAAYAERNLTGMESLGEALQDGGQFGVPQRTSPGASAGLRLMAYVGRDPKFGLPQE